MSYSCYEHVGICPGCGEACKIESAECAGSSHDKCSKCHHVFNRRSWWQDDGMEKPTQEQVLRYLKDFKALVTHYDQSTWAADMKDEDYKMEDEQQKFWDEIKAIVNG